MRVMADVHGALLRESVTVNGAALVDAEGGVDAGARGSGLSLGLVADPVAAGGSVVTTAVQEIAASIDVAIVTVAIDCQRNAVPGSLLTCLPS